MNKCYLGGFFVVLVVMTLLMSCVNPQVPSVQLSGDKIFVTYSVSGVTGFVDTTNHTVTVTLVTTGGKSDLKPVFSLSEGATLRLNSVVQVSGETLVDFSVPRVFTISAADGSTVDFTITVIVLDPSRNISAFSISDGIKTYKGTVSGNDIQVRVPSSLVRTALVPVFSASPKAKVLVGGVNQISSVTEVDLTDPVAYRVMAEDGSFVDYTVTLVNYSAEKVLLTFKYVDGVTTVNGTINEGTKLVTLDERTFGTVVSSVVPSFTVSPLAQVSRNGVSQISGTTAVDLTSNQVYTVTAEDGSTAQYTVSQPVNPGSSAAELTTFGLTVSGTAYNASAAELAAGAIVLTVPNGTDSNLLKTLKAAFMLSPAATVKVGTVAQTSASTSLDYSASEATPIQFQVTSQNGLVTKTWTVTVRIAPPPASFTAFSLAGISGTINTTKRLIWVGPLPVGTDLTNLAPTFTAVNSAGVALTNVRVGGGTQVSGSSTQNFRPVVTYTLVDGVYSYDYTVIAWLDEMVSTSDDSSFFIKADGTLLGTGKNYYGSLGDNTQAEVKLPKVLATNVRSAAAGQTSLLVKRDGTLWGTGRNDHGELGLNDKVPRTVWTEIPLAGTTVKAAFVSDSHSFFLKADGSLWAMGSSGSGQFGTGVFGESLVPVKLMDGVVQASVGVGISCILKDTGDLYMAGSNTFRLLDSSSTYSSGGMAELVMSSVRTVSTDSYLAAAVKLDGTAWTWGSNVNGGTGATIGGSSSVTSSPYNVGLTNVQGAATSIGNTTWFLKTDGTVWGKGANTNGQLGQGNKIDNATPVQLAENMIGLSGRYNQALMVKADGTTWGVGSNIYSYIGHDSVLLPTPVDFKAGFSDFYLRSVGISGSVSDMLSYGKKSDGTWWVSRKGTTIGYVSEAIPAHSSLALGNNFGLMVTPNGLKWWGTSDYRVTQFNSSSLGFDDLPDPGTAGDPTVKVYASYEGSFYQTTAGALWVVGYNNSNRAVGSYDSNVDYKIPQKVITSGVKEVFPGLSRTIVLNTDGSLTGSGSNSSGMLGKGAAAYCNGFLTLGLGTNNQQAALGDTHTLVVKNDGNLWVSGSNASGELGLGTTGSPQTAFAQVTDSNVAGLVAEAAAGTGFSVVRLTNGSVWAVGKNSSCQLGNGLSTDCNVWARVLPPGSCTSSVTERVLRTSSTMGVAKKADGTWMAWGSKSEWVGMPVSMQWWVLPAPISLW